MAVDVDKIPETEAEKYAIRGLLSGQCWEVLHDKTRVTCPCGWQLRLTRAFKCFYCGLWFCGRCAERHFHTEKPARRMTLRSLVLPAPADADRSAGPSIGG